MATSSSRQNTFIYKLPFSITREICLSLDVDKAWERLASEIGYTLQDVKVFELAYMHYNGSPSKELLTDWGSRNPTATDLYFKLQKIQRKREMQILEAWFSSTSNSSGCNKIPLPKRENSLDVESLSDIDTRALPKPPGRNNTAMTSSTNASLNDNFNFYKPEKEKKSGAKGIEEKDMSYFVSKKSKDKFDCHSMESGTSRPEPSIHEDACSVSSLGAGKEDMEKPSMTDDEFYKKLEGHEGYSSLKTQDGSCDIDVAVALMGTQSFTNKELNQATNGFSDQFKLGEGTFGSVYYGELKKTRCAIKRLNRENEYSEQSSHVRAEMKSLTRYRHENIVPLYGYALDGTELCLIYQYMPNGSLEDRLQCRRGTPPLTWSQRISILKGAACGLQYLHTLDEKPLIHGDIKSSNVLLDKYMEAKIGDFGLAQSVTGGTLTGVKTHITKKQVHSKDYECKAYYPPESNRGSKMSIKGDTYSFGVVIYEVCTGEKAYDEKREGIEACFLADYIHDSVSKNSEKCLSLMDQRGDNCPKEIYMKVFQSGNYCTEKLKKNRPDMVQVFEELERIENEYRQKIGVKSLPGHVAPCVVNVFGGGGFYGQLPTSHCYPSFSVSSNPSSGKVSLSSFQRLPSGQEPEAVMLQRMYDEGIRYPPNTPDTADVNDFKNPLYCQSDPKKLAQMKNYEEGFKFPKETPEMSGNFKDVEKEYEIADDGRKTSQFGGISYESDQRKMENMEKFDDKNLCGHTQRFTTTSDNNGLINQETADITSHQDVLVHQQACDSLDKETLQEVPADKPKQVCAVPATNAEENIKMKQKRDDLYAKYEKLIQQGGFENGEEGYEDEEESSIFGSGFDTIRFQNDYVAEDYQNEQENEYEETENCPDEQELNGGGENESENTENETAEVQSATNAINSVTISEHQPVEVDESSSSEGCVERSETKTYKESFTSQNEHLDVACNSSNSNSESKYVNSCNMNCEGDNPKSSNVNSNSNIINKDSLHEKSNSNLWTSIKKSEPTENNEQFV